MSKKENGDICKPDDAIFRYNCFVGLLRCVAPISLASKDACAVPLSAFFNSSYRALCCTCSAAYTGILIDLELAVSFRDSAYGTLSCTCSA